jgi:hypothetical protein
MCATAPALAQQAAPQRMYKCIDARGKTYYTQIPPRECLGRDSQELNQSGMVVKRSEKGPTASEIQARDADKKKKEEEAEKTKEQRRKELALLNTYSSERDIEDQRSRALAEAQDQIASTEKSIEGAKKRQQDLEKEKEFYTKKPMPTKLKQDIANLDTEIKNQNALLEAKKAEIAKINAKYDDDKKRYIAATTKK